jgi:hypothetical protein
MKIKHEVLTNGSFIIKDGSTTRFGRTSGQVTHLSGKDILHF